MRDWRAGMGGGVDRDGHGDESGVWTDYCFLLFRLGRRGGGMFRMSGSCAFLKELCRDVNFTRAGRCGDQADVGSCPALLPTTSAVPMSYLHS